MNVTRTRNHQRRVRQWTNNVVLIASITIGLLVFQVLINLIIYSHLTSSSLAHLDQASREAIQADIDQLQEDIHSLQDQLQQQQHPSYYQEDGNFLAFMIRDSKRVVPTQPPIGFHIFDYIDPAASPDSYDNPHIPSKTKLYHNAHFVENAKCASYNVICYKQKILQVFQRKLLLLYGI